jgi:hypothetical protein
MAKSYGKSKGRKETGRFIAIPHSVLDHPDYIRQKGNAVKLLNELARQYNGKNNGNLTVAYSVVVKRGFNSKETVAKAKNELLEAGLIVQTRKGRFMNPGSKCDLYAITWRAIDECLGCDLEIGSTNAPYRKFSIAKPSPETGTGSYQKPGRQRARGEDGRFTAS